MGFKFRKFVNVPTRMSTVLGLGVVVVAVVAVTSATGVLPWAITKASQARALVENPVRNLLARVAVTVPDDSADPGED